MLNFLNAIPPMQPIRGSEPAPFQWVPAGVAFCRRQARPIIGCAAMGVAVGLIYMAAATPQYTAIATVVIDTRAPHPVENQQAPADWQSESAYIESQEELIRSAATLRGVVDRLHLDQNPVFVPREPGPIGRFVASIKAAIPGIGNSMTGLDEAAQAKAKATAALSRMLEVSRAGTTSVLDVGVRTPDRNLSAQLANAVTEAYMAQQIVAVSETTRRAGIWLQSRVGELRNQAVAADRAVQQYKAAHNIVDVATNGGTSLMNEQQLSELNQQVAHAQSRLAEAQARYEQTRSATVDAVANGVVTSAQQDTVMTALRQQYADAVRREADLTARMGPTHGAVVLQHNLVVELQHNIEAELGRLTAAYRNDYEVAKANLQAIQGKLNDQVTAAAKTNIERSELRSLQSSSDAYRQIYQNFLQRFTQAMQDQSYPITDARVAAPALPPMDRSAPKTSIVLAVALTLGMAMGVVIAVTREAMDATVRTFSQLSGTSGLDCLGAVPQAMALAFRLDWRWLRSSRTSARRGELQVPTAFRQASQHPDSAIAEAVHAVRVAAARQNARGREVRVIGCVSVMGGEGTSTFAANLAFALAATGQRTTLVDWNSESPWLTETMAPNSKIGAHELAAREMTLSEIERRDGETGLRFIGQSVGERRRAHLRDGQVRSMLAALRDLNDVVVLDLPPMRAGSAAVRMSDMVDGFVLVTRWGSTTQATLSETLSRTAAMDAFFLGAVLSRCDLKRMRLYPNPAQSQMIRPSLAVTADV